MLLPRIWDEDLFENMDNWMSWPDESEFFGKKNPLYGKHAKNLMKTDVRETEDAYEVDIDLPGFKKDEVTITVENGYLNIIARQRLYRRGHGFHTKHQNCKADQNRTDIFFLIIFSGHQHDHANDTDDW